MITGDEKVLVFFDELATHSATEVVRIHKALSEIAIVASVSFREVELAFNQLSTPCVDFTEINERLNRVILEKEKPSLKTYHNFIPKTIGRQRRR